MEKRGQVNCYEPYNWKGDISSRIYTINLADGTTPLIAVFGGKPYSSVLYRLPRPAQIAVNHAWYRPRRSGFDRLDPSLQDHVLNGGLLHQTLYEALNLTVVRDTVKADWDYETFQKWCLEYYDRRLPPLWQEDGEEKDSTCEPGR